MYISLKLATETEELIETVKNRFFSDYSFIAKGTIISRTVKMLDTARNNPVKNYIPNKGELVASESSRLNLTADALEFINNMCKEFQLTRTEAIHAVLSTAMSTNACRSQSSKSFRILSLNINDFGGHTDHLGEHTEDNQINWEYWKTVDKKKVISKTLEFIQEMSPDIIFLQEMEVNNSSDSVDFVIEMQRRGYVMEGNFLKNVKASMTVCFLNRIAKEKLQGAIQNQAKEYRSGRDYRIKIGEYILWGVHIPPKYDEKYWKKLFQGVTDKCLMIGDFNTFSNSNNQQKFLELLSEHNATDIWAAQGGTASEVLTCGGHVLDHAIITAHNLNDVLDMKIIFTTFSDHAALVVDICCP